MIEQKVKIRQSIPDAPWEREWREAEEHILNRPSMLEEKRVRHLENLHGRLFCEGLTGRWHGVFYRDGIPHFHKKRNSK